MIFCRSNPLLRDAGPRWQLRIAPYLVAICAAAYFVVSATPSASEEPRVGSAELLQLAVADGLGKSSVYGAYLAALEAERSWDLRQAATLMARVLEENPDDEQLMRSAFKLSLSAGLVEPSLALARKIDGAGIKDPIANLLLVIRNIQDKNYGAARDRLAVPQDKGMAAFAAPIAVAWAAFGFNDVDGALSSLAQLKDGDGFGVLRQLQEGLINDLGGRPEAAEAAYRSLMQNSADTPVRIIRAIGSFLERQGRANEAKEIYDGYVSNHPGSNLFEAELNRVAKGHPGPQIVTNPAEGIAEGLFHLASAVPKNRGDELAMLYAQLALAARPDFALAKLLVGDLLDFRRRYSDANDVYRSIGPESPFRWAAQLRIADNLNDLDDLEGAVSLLSKLAEERQDHAEPLITQGNLLRYSERFSDAIQAYDKAFARIDKIEKSHWNLYYNRGVALERTKLWDRAEADFLKALELEPDQPFVLNYLGYSWVEQGRNIGRARKMIEKAVSRRRDDGYIIDSLGWVLYRLGEWKEAARHLERAVLLRPQDAVINDHFGDALWRVNRRNEARFQWKRALSMDPDEELIEGIESKLKNGLGKPEVLEQDG
jgi:tetratricopeptide (TPR) repeat protein